MSYKSTRLLVEAINAQMTELRKHLMRLDPPEQRPRDDGDAYEPLGELRKLVDELAAKADRPTLEDVTSLSPGDYVATMKPIVGKFHRQLMVADRLCACLCEDLQAVACVLVLVGDGKTLVRTAHDPSRPEAQLAVEAILTSIDNGTKQVVSDGVAEAEKVIGIEVPESPSPESVSDDEVTP